VKEAVRNQRAQPMKHCIPDIMATVPKAVSPQKAGVKLPGAIGGESGPSSAARRGHQETLLADRDKLTGRNPDQAAGAG